MKVHLGSAFIALSLLAATSWAHAQDKERVVTQPGVKAPAHTASDMSDLYYNDGHLTDCGKLGGVALPAFFCTGIIIRAAIPGVDPNSGARFNSWNVSPEDKSTGGVSFSYIRTDSKFQYMPLRRTSGFTLYPALGQYRYQGSDKKSQLNVICAFPIDGFTNLRGPTIGCGPPTGQNAAGTMGEPCQKQGITTAKGWYDDYKKSTHPQPKLDQCGFDVTSAQYDIADAFNQVIAAMALLGSEVFADHNELRIEEWSAKPDVELPIQSFFYTDNAGSAGWTYARTDQQAYFAKTGEFVPVIQIIPPATPDAQFKFHFNLADQLVPPPQ